MKKIILAALLLTNSCLAAIWVSPAYVGDAEQDSVVISFCVFDTTLYPVIADADSITAIRLGPDNTLIDSLDTSSSQLLHPRTGWYEIHYRASDPGGSTGTYRVYVRVNVGGDWRGAATVSYTVIGDGVDNYLAQLVTQSAEIRDSVGVILQQLPDGGSGAYPCTLTTFDQTNQVAVPGAAVTLYNSDESALIASGVSDNNGRLILALDADDYSAYSRAMNYNPLQLPKSISTTSGGSNDTLFLSPFAPGEPADPGLCRVYGYVYNLHGAPLAEVVVRATLETNSVVADGAVISPYAASTSTDTLGYWYLDLIPTSHMQPEPATYDFSIYYPAGTIFRRAVAVPDSSNYWLK